MPKSGHSPKTTGRIITQGQPLPSLDGLAQETQGALSCSSSGKEKARRAAVFLSQLPTKDPDSSVPPSAKTQAQLVLDKGGYSL